MPPDPTPGVAVVAIGRNEGERLKSCLRSVAGQAPTVVYADSGSADGSADYARAAGCQVVDLDPARPFSAARARNEGFACLQFHDPDAAFVLFLDGDCDLAGGWLDRAVEALQQRPDVGIVCGHVREIHPKATVYNKLCDLEWQQTPGEIRTSGGRFLVRKEIFAAVGGFRPDVIAAEDDEFCIRVRKLGWKILLIDAEMARHDAHMTRFSQWWARARRSGHGYAQVSAMHGKGEERYFVRDCRRVLLWGLLVPVVALGLAPFTWGLSLAGAAALYAVQFLRIAQYGRRRGWSGADARIYAFFTVLGKFPALLGLLSYQLGQLQGRAPAIIEYKGREQG
jgi:GT2 family glycosyltransferase